MNPGDRLGPYEITAPIGAGGMGEVYRARDSRLGRDVAIKVLPPALSNDADYLARFQREAQALAALNHPNIAQIYGLEQNAIVMELVDGDTLQTPQPLDDALAIARQIAEALEAAHDKGIIHRDLKPGNIKITPDGIVKVLDFGLAKTVESAVVSASGSNSPTLTLRATEAGIIIGTAAYMSPEQARGKAVDKRADIWAFGILFIEMLTGKLVHNGETVSDVLASVITKDPDTTAIPAHLRPIIDKCVRRDPSLRWRDIGDVRIALDEAAAAPRIRQPEPRTRIPWIWIVATATCAIAAIVAAGLLYQATRPSSLKPLIRVDAAADFPVDISRPTVGPALAIAPDGSRIAAVIRSPDGVLRIHTRLTSEALSTVMPGTENAHSPFFSPDGQWLGFVSGNTIFREPAQGGPSYRICDAPTARGLSWGPNNTIVFSANTTSPLSRVSDNGGAPAPLTKLAQTDRTHRWPQVISKDLVIFTSQPVIAGTDYDRADIVALSIPDNRLTTVLRGGFGARYLPSGHLVFARTGSIFAVPFRLDQLQTIGSPIPVLNNVAMSVAAGPHFAVAANGTAIYVSGRASTKVVLARLQPSGKTELLVPALAASPRFSPDGRFVAFTLESGQGRDIWVKDLSADNLSRRTFLPGLSITPLWTPDGRHIVFHSNNPAAPGIYIVRADGSGSPQRLSDQILSTPQDFSPDGRTLLFVGVQSRRRDVLAALFESDERGPRLGTPRAFAATDADEMAPAFSPDGRWIAYSSDESGTIEVYVQPFPGPGGRWQISSGGGSVPRWSRTAKRILFITPEGRVMAADYSVSGHTFSSRPPRPWLETPLGTTLGYDLAPDGNSIVTLIPEIGTTAGRPYTQVPLLFNFFDELQRRAPVGKVER